MTHRLEQLESALRRSISTLLAEGLNDPRIRGMVSVTSVKVSPDRRHARVGVSVMPDARQKSTVEGLKSAAGRIQALVARNFRARTVPQLEFWADESLKRQAEILGAIREALEEDQELRSQTPLEDDPEEPER